MLRRHFVKVLNTHTQLPLIVSTHFLVLKLFRFPTKKLTFNNKKRGATKALLFLWVRNSLIETIVVTVEWLVFYCSLMCTIIALENRPYFVKQNVAKKLGDHRWSLLLIKGKKPLFSLALKKFFSTSISVKNKGGDDQASQNWLRDKSIKPKITSGDDTTFCSESYR